jgi:LuxR family maltose regulon positive regulatory protein
LLALAAVRAGQLRLAYQESQAALDLIEQMAGYVLLKGYFEIAQIEVWYQWNRLEEARGLLRTVVHDAAAWQQLDLLAWGYVEQMQVALATSDWSLAQQALHEVEQLVRRERFGFYPGRVPTLEAQWWLAQGQVREASNWAAGVVFPEEPWERNLYDAFPVVVRVYFAERRWREALELLERWSVHLDRPANIEITMTYLAQSLVALHQADKSDQARGIAARLFALTEPEGYMRVYLNEGEPMRQALLAWLTSHSGQHPQASSTTTYVSRLLTAFEQEANSASPSLEAATMPDPLPSRVPQPSPAASALVASLTRREQEVLRLLVAGQTYAEMAEALVVSPNTIKSQVGSIYRKLNVRSRLEAYAAAQRLRLL